MKRILILLCSVFVFACAKEDKAPISGSAQGMKDGTKLYLQMLGESNKRIPLDTALIQNNTFTFDKSLPQGTDILIINSDQNPRDQLLLINDEAPLTLTLYADSLSTSLVTGSVENELFNEYRNTSRQLQLKKQLLTKKLQQAQRETDGVGADLARDEINKMDTAFISDKEAIITAHPDKMVAIFALSDLINAKVLKIEESEAYYDSFSENIKESTIGLSIKQYIAQLKSQRIAEGLASIGNKAPAFSAKTPDGEELSLEDTLGKYTIIDFWASWCRPCRMENPNVVNVYNKYHDKGLNIISVSLDRKGQEDRWKKAIKDDKMDWYHVSNLQFWQDPIPRSYGVRAIPATFLLDENGVIIAKNLRGPALGAKMEELLGKS